MKTKIFNIILTLMLTLLGVSEVSAKAAVDMSSGIRDQVYLLEWCSPHSTELSPAGVKPICRTGSFKLVAGVATVVYDGTSYPSGDVTVENRASALVPTTQTSLTTSASNIPLVSLFSNVTNGAFSLEGEGVLTIRVYLMDYADNVSFFQVRYKIDKTGPQLTFKDITENNDTTYYLPDATLSRVNVTQGVNKRDSSITTLTGDSFANPSILSYASSINSTAIARSGNVRDKLHAFYFKNQLATEPFTINTNASDSYFDPVMNTEFLDTSATSNMDGYTTDLVSGMNGFELTDASGLPLAPKSSSTTYTTDKLTSNGQNTQKNYRLRLYDNSVTSTGGLGNYSETAFYAVRDNTPPNIGGNNLATNETGAAERLLSYMDDVTVYDTGAYTSSPVHTPVSDGVSRFIAADNPMSLKYKFDDTGVTGNGSTVGLGCADLSSNLSSSYAGLCNAGIDTTLAAINIEDAANVGTFTQAINFPNRFINAGTDTNTNFSNVKDHMGWSGTNNMYGRYGVAYTSSTNSASNGYDKLCDLVGNCIAPQLSFRVVANVVDNDQSKLTIATLTGMTDDSGTPTGQILANGKNSYKMFYDLKDKYGNSVIPVVSKENANLQIKAVDSKLLFNNGLAINQLGSNPSWDKFVGVENLNPAPKMASFENYINTTGAILMTEGTGAIPTGNYAISLNSPVPTQGAYPYLSDASVLAVQNIDNKTNRILAPASMTYPSTGTTGRLGYADSTTVPTGNNLMSPMTLVNTGGIAESTGFQDITLNAMDYGKVSNPDTTGVTFAGLSTRFPNFEFASPYVYGLVGMRVLVDGYAGEHFKKLYSIERTATPTFSNYNVYERYLVGMDHTYDDQPNLMTFKSTTGSIATDDISTGVRYTNNGDLNLWTSPTPKLSYNIAGAMTYTDGYTSSGFHVSVEMSSKPNIIYDNAKLRAGFVAALSYQFSPDFGKFTAADSTNPNVTIRVPSVGRGLTKIDASPLTQYQMTRTYFDGIGAYALGTPSGTTDVPTIAPSVTNIAIIGLTNRYNALTTDTSGSQKNVNVEGELNRPTLIGNIKQNIATVSRGFGSASAAATAGKHWCSSNPAVPFTTLTTGFDNCTININGEKITFIEGNATIKCSGGSDSNTCMVTDKRAFIVKNGSLYLKSNISTLNSTGDQTAGQLFLGVMNDTGLANVTIADTDVNITSQDKSGWMFIDPKITNIDAFLFAQGPMVSYDANEKILGKNFFYSNDVARTSSLSNQLYINGSILTLNTITGARQNPLECPYIVDNCTSSIAQIFDLTYTRSFRILSKSTMSGIATDTELVPYYKYSDCSNTPAGTTCIPNDPLVPPWTFAKKAGGLTGTAVNTASNTELRSITDTTYQPYPIIIERDLRWNSAPSRLFQVNR